jgi:hypothetical protein
MAGSERITPALSPSLTNTPSLATKPKRILACIRCQQRKVKCPREFPCSNCVKANAQCIPAGTVTRQRRRRFPERELLERVRHYEGILRQHKIKFDSLHPESTISDQSSPSTQDHGSPENEKPDEPRTSYEPRYEYV